MDNSERLKALSAGELPRLLDEFEALLNSMEYSFRISNLALGDGSPGFLRSLHSIKSIVQTVYGNESALKAHELESLWAQAEDWPRFYAQAGGLRASIDELTQTREQSTSSQQGAVADKTLDAVADKILMQSFYCSILTVPSSSVEKIAQMVQRGRGLLRVQFWIAGNEPFKLMRARVVLSILQKKLWIGSIRAHFTNDHGHVQSIEVQQATDVNQAVESTQAVLIECLAIGDCSREEVLDSFNVDNVFFPRTDNIDFAETFDRQGSDQTRQTLCLLMRKYAPNNGVNPEQAFVSFSMEWRPLAIAINSLGNDYSREFVDNVRAVMENLAPQQANQLEVHLDWSDCQLPKLLCGLLLEVFLHLARNVVSHACQSLEQRRSKRKNPALQLGISLALDGSDLVLVVEDDGPGIESGRLPLEMLSKKQKSDLKGVDTQDLQADSGEKANLLSGRSLGLSTALHLVQNRLHGTVHCSWQKDVGTRFEIRIPRNASQLEVRFLNTPNGLVAVPEVLILEELSQIDQFRSNGSQWVYASRQVPILSGVPENQSSQKNVYLLHQDGLVQAVVFAESKNHTESCLLPFEGTSVYSEQLEQWVQLLELPN